MKGSGILTTRNGHLKWQYHCSDFTLLSARGIIPSSPRPTFRARWNMWKSGTSPSQPINQSWRSTCPCSLILVGYESYDMGVSEVSTTWFLGNYYLNYCKVLILKLQVFGDLYRPAGPTPYRHISKIYPEHEPVFQLKIAAPGEFHGMRKKPGAISFRTLENPHSMLICIVFNHLFHA